MPIIFEGPIGSVVQLDDPGVQCTMQLLGLDPDITFAAQRSIVTRVTLSQQVNVQFLHTLGALVYIYVFGDRMGQVSLSGLAFSCGCPQDDDVDTIDIMGAELMLNWYRTNRASRRQLPTRVMIGNYVIEGFVTGFTEDVVDPSISLVQWGVNMMALPDDEGDGLDVSPLPSFFTPPDVDPLLSPLPPNSLVLPPGKTSPAA